MKLFFILLTLFFLISCATIISRSEYQVTISSEPNNADITIENRAGQVIYTGTTPSTVVLNAGAGFFQGENYIVTFTKDGYKSCKTQVQRGVDGWYIGGNILIGGFLGWLIIDPATGAMWTLPPNVSSVLTPLESSIYNENTLAITTIDKVPFILKSELITIK